MPGPLELIRQEIRAAGPLSFARFMELALYEPRQGYYARSSGGLGATGDYVTASDVGRHFGRCMARQIREIDARIGPLAPFHVVEFGAGRGLLARDVLDAMERLDPHLRARLRYVLVDRSPAMRRTAARAVPEATVLAPEALQRSYRGCALAVELFDALPTHRLRRRGDRLLELFVDVASDGSLVECEGTPSAEVASLARRWGAAPQDGDEAEVTPSAAAELERIASALERGVILAVDYGDRAEPLYARQAGTLLAYHRQTTNRDYLERVGLQDLTAHVNFSQLESRARELGLDVLGLTTQDRFLIANGVLEAFEDGGQATRHDAARAKGRLQAMQLIHPEGMGRAFKVLALSKGGVPSPALKGLSDPFAR